MTQYTFLKLMEHIYGYRQHISKMGKRLQWLAKMGGLGFERRTKKVHGRRVIPLG